MGRKYYGRFTDFVPPEIEKSRFQDDKIIYIPGNGEACYQDMDYIWDTMAQNIENRMVQAKADEEPGIEIVGRELIRWIRQRDSFAVAMILNLNWDYCWKNFFSRDVPVELMDMVINLRFRNGEEKKSF